MTISDEKLNALQHALQGLELPHTSLDQAIAIGVQGNATNAWLTLSVQNGVVMHVQAARLESGVDADHLLGVKTAVLASTETWLSIAQGGESRVISAADGREFEVSGQLSFFIRHVRSIVGLLESFGRAVFTAQ